MNRRRFLELLGTAALGSGIVYSFPSVIVPKNIAIDWNVDIMKCANDFRYWIDNYYVYSDRAMRDKIKNLPSFMFNSV